MTLVPVNGIPKICTTVNAPPSTTPPIFLNFLLDVTARTVNTNKPVNKISAIQAIKIGWPLLATIGWIVLAPKPPLVEITALNPNTATSAPKIWATT